MRKDVKRSLLLWPAAASVTITAVSWFPTQFDGDQAAPTRTLASLVPAPRIQPLVVDSAAIVTQVEMTARSEHGARAMRMPPRVAAAFGVSPDRVIKAPVRNEQQELAGLMLEPRREMQSSIGQLAKEILEGDLDAADQIADGDRKGWDQAGVVQRLRQRKQLAQVSVKESDRGNSPLASFNSTAPTLQIESPVLNPPTTIAASVLPRSNRALGRRQLVSPAVADSTRGPSLEGSLSDLDRSPSAQTPELSLDTSPADAISNDADPSQHVLPRIVDQPSPATTQEKLAAQPRGADSVNPAGWPVTTKLDEQLKMLTALALHSRSNSQDQFVSYSASSEQIADWTQGVTTCLETLRSLPRLGDDRSGATINELGSLASQGQRRAEQIADREQQIQWLVTSYAVARRVAVWRLVWEVTRGGNAWMVGDQPKSISLSVSEGLASVRADLDETGDVDGWSRYLLLDEFDQLATNASSEDRIVLAQRFLSRLRWHRLNPEQQRWLERESILQLSQLVRPWAQDAVDYATLMHQIELYEGDAIDPAAIDVAGAVQTLRFADNPLANQIADAIDTHYRNANLRLAISANMLQRIMPEIEAKTVPVEATILGSRVRGKSHVDTDLAVELLPSPDRWTLRLNTTGQVTTQSTGVRDAVAVHTVGRSQFESGTPIEITTRGVSVDRSEVDVHGNTHLRGIDTEYDGWPLIGPLVRSIAENRYRSMAPQANRMANRTMQHRIETEIDQMLEARIDTAEGRLSQLVLGPLGRLQLDPKVTDMQTTDERLLARFRVAGDWQMAAFTPRPRAPGSSLMSLQVHQSALNNTLEQLVPRGEPLLIHDLFQQVSETFGKSEVTVPDDLPDDVTIQFSRTRPITIEIDEDRLWITLRIVRLRRADSVDLTQFIVRAAYKPQVDGVKASLVRDEHLRISGPRMSMRERLPARTIFNKVFSTNHAIPITLPNLQEHPALEGLAISQLELRNGWLAIAVSESDAPRIALAP